MAYDYKDPRELDIQRIKEERIFREDARVKKAKSRIKTVFARSLEIVLIALSYFQSSYLVRFLSAKLAGDFLVEVSVRFGPNVGHSFSTIYASVIAEPRLIAVGVAAVFLVIEAFAFIFRLFGRGKRKKAAYAYSSGGRDRRYKDREENYRLTDRRAKAARGSRDDYDDDYYDRRRSKRR